MDHADQASPELMGFLMVGESQEQDQVNPTAKNFLAPAYMLTGSQREELRGECQESKDHRSPTARPSKSSNWNLRISLGSAPGGERTSEEEQGVADCGRAAVGRLDDQCSASCDFDEEMENHCEAEASDREDKSHGGCTNMIPKNHWRDLGCVMAQHKLAEQSLADPEWAGGGEQGMVNHGHAAVGSVDTIRPEGGVRISPGSQDTEE